MQLGHCARLLSLVHLSQSGIWCVCIIYFYNPARRFVHVPRAERPVRPTPHMSGLGRSLFAAIILLDPDCSGEQQPAVLFELQPQLSVS
jgi:hypothetical protein